MSRATSKKTSNASDICFEFPDVADFPENDAPVCQEDYTLHDFGDLVAWVVKNNDFDNEELRILKGQMWRVQSTAQLYYSLPEWRTPDLLGPCALSKKGILIKKLDTDRLVKFFKPDVDELLKKPRREPAIDQIDCVKVRKDQDAIDVVTNHLRTLLPAAKAYRGKEYSVRDVTVQVSRPGDYHHYQQFRDCKTVTKLLNLHVDPKPGILKALVYLNSVDLDNGPFQCIPGSNHWKRNEMEQIFAWGNSVGNYCHTPKHRKVACAFPKKFRKNAIVGRLIPDGSELSNFLLTRFKTLTSSKGNTFLFDPCFLFHRGGLCQTGTRINLQVRLV